MPTTTEITDIRDRLNLNPYAGDFAADYDWDAIQTDYITNINAVLPDGVTLFANGQVIAELGIPAAAAAAIDWDETLDNIDIDAILQRHDRTTKQQPLVRVRVPGTGEHIDDGTHRWAGESLDTTQLSADDLGCEPGTEYLIELVDEETGRVIESHPTTAT